jgi:hypothetical protein
VSLEEMAAIVPGPPSPQSTSTLLRKRVGTRLRVAITGSAGSKAESTALSIELM